MASLGWLCGVVRQKKGEFHPFYRASIASRGTSCRRVSVRLSVCPSVRLSVCPSVRLSVCHKPVLYRNGNT